jgi:hypothetical protein
MKEKFEKLFFTKKSIKVLAPIVKRKLARKTSPIPCHPRTGKRVVQSRELPLTSWELETKFFFLILFNICILRLFLQLYQILKTDCYCIYMGIL